VSSAGAGLFAVTHFGAVGDGKTLCTAAIQRAIDACGQAGGGLVLLPAGRYLSGALFLRSHVRLQIGAGASLVASQRPDDYPPVPSRWEGIERTAYASLINGDGLEGIAVEGPGSIEGRGAPWWQMHDATRQLRLVKNLPREAENPPEAPLRWPRPRVITLLRCREVCLRDLTITDSPSYNVHLVYCEEVNVHGLTIVGLEAQNSDGIQVDSCRRVVISCCSIASGGESIALKAGYNEDGRRVGLPCEQILVTSCHFARSHGAAFACGSETAAWIRDVVITNCTITDCRLGLHLRSPRGRGGGVERVSCTNLVLDRIRDSAIMLTHYFDSVRMDNLFGEPPGGSGNPEVDRSLKVAADDSTPAFRDIEFRGLTLGAIGDVAVIEGLAERFIEGVVLEDISAPHARSGVSCARVASLQISGLNIDASEGPAVAARDIKGLRVHRLTSLGPAAAPLIHLDNVAGAFIHGCNTLRTGADFVRLHGPRNRDVVVTANRSP
jgi:polygalacturonase